MAERLVQHAELFAYMQRLRIRVLRIVRGVRAGEYLISRQSASGMEFDGLREYEQGDDIRRIDWNSSARSNSLMVRLYREQENRTIVLLLDLSATTHLGSTYELKDSAMQTIALMIGSAAELCGDAVGVILFTHGAVSGIPPRKGRRHLLVCAEHILAAQGAGSTPDLASISAHIEQLVPRNACLFLITDGLLAGYKELCALIMRRAHCGVVRVRDHYEREVMLPPQLLLAHGEEKAGTGSVEGSVVAAYARRWYGEQDAFMAHRGIRYVDVTAGQPYDMALRLFLERGV